MVARAMLTMGENLVTVDITNLRRVNEVNTTIVLTDGTQMVVHPKDVTVYDANSLPAKEMEAAMNPTYLPFTGVEVEDSKLDRVLIHKGSKQAVVNMTDYQFRDGSYYMITLEDGMPMTVHPQDVKLFDSKSKIMQQYQEAFVSKKRIRQDNNADIDEFIFGL